LKLEQREAGSNENRMGTCSMLYWRMKSEEEGDGRRELRLLGKELAHAAEFFVALIQEIFGGEGGELVQGTDKEGLE